MLMTTTENVPEQRAVEALGLVDGSTVFSPGLSAGITAAFQALNEGEISAYDEAFRKARALARKEMVQKADRLGADAVVALRYGTAEIAQGLCEVVVYGTAVRLLKRGAT